GSDDAIIQRHGNLSLNPDECHIDSWEFEHLHQEALAGKMESAATALALYQGSFDHSLTHSPPLHSYRSQLERHYAELVPLLAKHYLAQSQTSAALALYQQALALDPVNEDFCAGLIKLLGDQGRTTELHKVLEQCRTHWQRELSIDLPAPLLAIYRESLSAGPLSGPSGTGGTE
ncbi:MAG TPA: tetratricopeptide repeat protein, partial [Candidatus Tenderia sp.]|nr:tetratricopeptide repeat protein [Candidatus Tenderia sp.]